MRNTTYFFLKLGSCLALTLLLSAPADAAASTPPAPLPFGVAWYPEQWPETRWERDLELMQAAHVDVVRIAEFSWSTMEPKEGVYNFAWLDRAIVEAAAHDIKVVLGTPTAAPPAWLTQKYPDVLRVNETGRREEHGGRQQYNFTSPRYLALARKIAEKMAIRYGRNPNVIGWQIDNEVGPASFDDGTKAKFHDWLRKKYGTLDNLNRRWAAAYWSQTYTRFDQVPMHSTGQNPGLLMAFKHFVTDMWTNYIRNQETIIRTHADRRQFVTTNSMHWYSVYDHYELHSPLDFASWDNYIPEGRFVWTDNAVQHDLVRGYKRKNFWVMETQAGYVNYGTINRSLDPGQMREMAWQAVGHGADALLYWQWRSAPNGQEQYYGTLLGPDGEPVPVYAEAQKIGAEFSRAGAMLAGTAPKAQVALLHSYASRWAIAFQPHHKDFDPIEEFDAFYRPLAHQAQIVDVVSADTPLEQYRLAIAPALNVVSEDEARHLIAYVRGGGHLVLGPRSGLKDEDNALYTVRQPGPLAALLGAHVEQYYALDTPTALNGDLGTGQATIWAEALAIDNPDTKVLMRYGEGNNWFANRPAIVTRRIGKGSITYVGAWLDAETMAKLTGRLLAQAEVASAIAGIPDDIEVCERQNADKKVVILINHGDTAHVIRLPAVMHDILNDRPTSESITLSPHDVAILSAEGKSAP
jgi:beta-galactosidase